jgi:hypothetical protein
VVGIAVIILGPRVANKASWSGGAWSTSVGRGSSFAHAQAHAAARRGAAAEPEGVAMVAAVPKPGRADLVEGFGQPGAVLGVGAARRGSELDQVPFDVRVAAFAGADLLCGPCGEDGAVEKSLRAVGKWRLVTR